MEFGTPNTTSVALVVGVTGMAGLSLAEALKKPAAPGGPWTVYGAARRPEPAWFPPSLLDHYIQFNALDPHDTKQNLSTISHHVTHLFWVALQAKDTEEANITANSAMLTNVINVFSSESPPSRLRHVTLQTGTKHYMGPDLNQAGKIISAHPPFHENMARLPFPNFYYTLEDILMSNSSKFTWSVHRSSIILGASSRSTYNMLLTLAAYALICRREGVPFRYPGTRYTWEHFCDASDAGLLAMQQIWAATSDAAKNQAFNCTNGDVFTWKVFWSVISEIFGVEPMAPEDGDVANLGWVAEMKEKGGIWDAIVRENGLVETKLEEITCFAAANMVLNFGFQHVSSMNKSREFGFLGYVDTLKSSRRWVERLREMNIIPKT